MITRELPSPKSVNPGTRQHPRREIDQKRMALASLLNSVIERDELAAVYEELVPALARLSAAEYATSKARLKEHFKRRLSTTDLDTAVKEERKSQKQAQLTTRSINSEAAQTGPRIVVEVGGQLHEIERDALSALALANKEKPSLFVDPSGRLVRINYSTKNVPSITPLSIYTLRHHMSLSADYISVKATSDDVVAIPTFPPLDVVRSLLEMNPIEYPFPPLSGITELPIMRPDGSIHQTPGYDPETEQVYIPGELIIPSIPETPTQDDVRAALATLDYWLADFPFADKASKAAALANAITVVIRPVIEGQVPLTLLDAPKQGTGKTILAQGIGILGTGRIVPTNAPTNDEEELRKKILTWLQTSPAVVIIDNVIHQLESSSLNAALTSPYVEDRELGSNTLLKVANRAVWFASGNNIKVGDDTARRCIKCHLDAKMESPHKRDITRFRIPGGVRGFFEWTIAHRAELVTAVLVLARNWYAQGKPTPDVLPIGSFEDWTTTIGGILQAAGVTDFLANMTEDSGESSIDEVSVEWKAFIDTVHTLYGNNPFTCFALAKRMLEEDETAETLRDTIPSTITKNLDSYIRSKGQDREFPKHMGKAFGKKLGVYFGTLCLQYHAVKYDRLHKTQWQIIETSTPPTPSTEPPTSGTEQPATNTSQQEQVNNTQEDDRAPAGSNTAGNTETAQALIQEITTLGGALRLREENGQWELKYPQGWTDEQAQTFAQRVTTLSAEQYQLLRQLATTQTDTTSTISQPQGTPSAANNEPAVQSQNQTTTTQPSSPHGREAHLV